MTIPVSTGRELAPRSPARIFISHSHEDDPFCHEMVRALRGAGADVWYNERNLDLGQLMTAIEVEVRARPIFIVILSPMALRSGRVYAECSWASAYQRHDANRIFLPVLAQPVDHGALWMFLQDFLPRESLSIQHYPPAEAIHRTLRALALVPANPGSAPQP
ncbi:MAG TPA: toll/interleukin-1 receptor domain-containing protein, partial [Ktedonobacterales bacterium]|nr:toll/interleukin-1 receptor domain-containing protein [Ktedonobacterales bacterium]